MSAAEAPTAPPAFDETTWDRARRWRPDRRALALGALLLLAMAVIMVTTARRTGFLDPGAVDPSGSRAVANILGDLGVRVSDVRTTADAVAATGAAAGSPGASGPGASEGATVLVTEPDLLTEAMLADVLTAGPARLILIRPLPGSPLLSQLAAGTGLDTSTGADVPGGSAGDGAADGATGDLPGADRAGDEAVAPRCQLPEAVRAGAAELPGLRYDARAWPAVAAACYDRPSAAALVVLPPRAGLPEVVVLGSSHPLTNDGLDVEGNAALALGLLGSRDELVWWRPDPGDPALAGQAGADLVELVPAWVIPVLLQLLLTCVLVAWWRGRRLGRVVVETLPVVVRAGETTAGHARLLHASRARGEAALHLRTHARQRLRIRLGMPPGSRDERLVATVASRCARAPDEVAALLYGPEPTTDAELVVLHHQLEALISEVGGR